MFSLHCTYHTDDFGALEGTFREGAGFPAFVFATGSFLPVTNGNIRNVFYTSSMEAFETAIHSHPILNLLYTLSYDPETSKFTLSGTGAFTASFTAKAALAFGFPASTNLFGPIITSSYRPWFIWNATYDGRSRLTHDYEPQTLFTERVSDSGRSYAIGKRQSANFVDWSFVDEERANLFSDFSSSNVPFTYQRFLEHVRARRPFVAFSSSTTLSWENREGVYVMRPETSYFQPRNVFPDYYEHWNLDVSTRALKAGPIEPLVVFTSGTFARASEASWFYTGSSTLVWWGVNELRRLTELTPEGLPYYVTEGESTNNRRDSEDQTVSTYLSSSAIVTGDAAVAPDGITDAEQVVFSAFNGTVRGSIASTSDNEIYTNSLFVKAEQTTKYRLTFQRRDLVTEEPMGLFTASEAWSRGAFTTNLGISGSPNPQVRLYNSGTIGLNYYIWGWQAESGSFPTSYIRTTGVSATRAEENLTIPGALNQSGWFNEPWHFWCRPEFSSEDPNHPGVMGLYYSNSNLDYIRWTGSRNRLQVAANNTIVIDTSASFIFPRDAHLRISLNPKAGTLEVRGATVGNGVYRGTPWTWTTGADMRIGVSNSPSLTANFYGCISEPIRGK